MPQDLDQFPFEADAVPAIEINDHYHRGILTLKALSIARENPQQLVENDTLPGICLPAQVRRKSANTSIGMSTPTVHIAIRTEDLCQQ